jgi:hypothetical protein
MLVTLATTGVSFRVAAYGYCVFVAVVYGLAAQMVRRDLKAKGAPLP